MYATLWKLLPGDRGVKALTCLGMVLAVVAILWYVIFPWLEPKIQFDHSEVRVRTSTPVHSPAPHR